MAGAKALLPTFIVAIMLIAGCDDSVDSDSATTEPKSEAIAEFTQSKIDLGDLVMRSSQDVHEVVSDVKNTGTAPLKISKITKSCQCSKAAARESTVEPGQSMKIEIEVTVKHAGVKHVYLNVNSNSAVKPHKSLEVAWNAIAPYEVDAKELDFGNVIPTTNYKRKIRFTPHAHGACAASQLSISPDFKSEHLSTSVGDDNVITVSLLTGSEPGRIAEELEFHVEGCWQEKLSIPVRWETQPPVAIKPDFVFLNKLKPGDQVERQLVLSSVGKSELIVESVDDDNVQIKWERISASRQKGTLRFTAPATPGRFSQRVRLAVTQPNTKPLVLSIAGSVSE